QNIHDFAWFTSKNFAVNRDYAHIQDADKNVTCWTFFDKSDKNLWKNAINCVKQSISFYSDVIGAYPYNNVSAVEGPLSIGGGMEYPNITVVTGSSPSSLENVIIHEVAHNWFYGMLASNERDESWIDEGFTSFYESEYYDKYYPGQGFIEQNLGIKSNIFRLNELPARYYRELGWIFLLKENIAQNSNRKSEKMSMFNYYIMSYLKPVTSLYMIENYLGRESYKNIMNEFFDKYKFTHIYPNDIIDFFSSESSDTILRKYFDDLLIRNSIPDYKIARIKKDSIIIKNKRADSAPLFLYINDSLVVDKGFSGTKKFYLPKKSEIIIDKYFYSPDFNRNNNYYRPGFFKTNKPFRPSLGGVVDNPLISEFPFLPLLAYNTADGLMPGIMFYATVFPKKKFEYQIIPLYGIKSGNLVGIANLSFYIHPSKSPVKEFELYTKSARFGISNYNDDSRIKLEYGVKIKLRTDPTEFYDSKIIVRSIAATDFYSGVMKEFYNVISYFKDHRKINPWSFTLNFEMGKGFAKTSAEIINTITYNQRLKGLTIRIFAGKFIYNSTEYYGNYNFRMSGNLGMQDYFYDNLFISRPGDIRVDPQYFWAHQFIRNDGGFTLYTPFGQSNNWLVSINMNSSTPIKFIEIYFNAGVCPSIISGKFADFYYETGIRLNILDDLISVYFPINTSSVIWEASNNIYTNNYFQKIRFTLSLDKFNLLTYREKPYLLF
ncbi:MAG TPA: M1 family aminopeptidase, partial [Bacteroidales bacterium]|nr:M1 family aminopeptidase [Bacteroidales bacterium]